jgi:hypothetical protein
MAANADGNQHYGNPPDHSRGGGGAHLNPGRYTQFNDVPIANLSLNLMDRIGGRILDRFGDSTELLGNV